MHSEHQYGFDLQFLIEGEQLPLDEIRNKIIGMGDSVLVVGDEKGNPGTCTHQRTTGCLGLLCYPGHFERYC